LAVLDLLPVGDGMTFTEGVRNAVDLARQAERFGYQRYWFAEHHLHPRVDEHTDNGLLLPKRYRRHS
jgi:alkanesulfonate monooxygenase SsuD/methylene tetrahydromethanopterin reductase-like flavin-dependent oxidoreductase (luciferase family)